MKNTFLILLILLSFACKNSKEDFLYDENDPEYTAIKALALNECVEKSKSLQALKKTYEFDNYNVGDIFEYKYKDTNSNEYYIHLIIKTITASDMTLDFYSREVNSDFDATAKTVTFTEANALDIYNTIATGVCTTENSFLGATSLSSTSSLTYRFNSGSYRYYKDSEFKTYEQRTGTFYAEIDVPTFALLFNRTISDKTKLVASSDTVNTTSFTRSSMSMIGSDTDDCKVDCSVAPTVTCDVSVDTNYYKPGTKTSGTSGYSATQIKSILELTNCI